MKYYVLDENNNKVEAFDKQGVLSVLAQAIEDGTLNNIVSDAAFVSKLKCCVGETTNYVAFITQAKYNELEASGLIKNNCYYYITDDAAADDINEAFETINSRLTTIENKLKMVDLEVSRFSIRGIDAGLVLTNEIKKKGNYVIANLDLLLANQDYSGLEISIPQGLEPNSTHTLMVGLTNQLGMTVYVSLQIQDTLDLTQIKAESGLIGLTIVNAGWEV